LIGCPVHYPAPSRVFPRLSEHFPRGFNVFRVDSCKRLIDELGTDGLKFLDQRLRPRGDVQPPGAPVFGIARPLNEPCFLKPVDDTAQSDRLELEEIRELYLAKTRRAGQPEQHLPLGAGHPEPDREAIERFTKDVPGFSNLERERFHWQPI
jgi:hypothetical protein